MRRLISFISSQEKSLPLDPIEVMKEDLRLNLNGAIRAISALSVYGAATESSVERLKRCVSEVLAEIGPGNIPGEAQELTYRTLVDAREAIVCDLVTYGEGRTVDDVQEHIYKLGFQQYRQGQPLIRYSLVNRFNMGKLWIVGQGERLTLTEEGRKMGRSVRARLEK